MTTITRDEAAKAYANGEAVEVTLVGRSSVDWRNVDCYGVFDDQKAYFRRKPKPMECWVIVVSDEVVSLHYSEESAKSLLSLYEGSRVAHMREVTE